MDMAFSTPLGPRVRKDMREGVERLTILPRRNSKVVWVALLVLILATFRDWRGIEEFLAHRDWLGSVAVAAVAIGWVLWALAFASEFLGTEIVRIQRGDLIVSRGIGPLRRNFRYPVRGISILDRDGPVVDEGAPPRLHHIYIRPKLGTVRFDYGGNTRYFAETLDMDEAEKVVAWLRLRLPRGASEMQAIGGSRELRL